MELMDVSLFPAFDFSRVFIEPWKTPASVAWNGQVILMGLFICWTCGILGSFIVVRRMALMGDAISHGILPGLALAFLFTGSLALAPMWVGACLAGLACSYCIEWLRLHTPIRQDAALGLVFTSFFALGVTLISLGAGDVHLDPDCILYGEIGFVPLSPSLRIGGMNLGNQALWTMGGVCTLIMGAVLVFYRHLLVSSFDSTLARSMGIRVRRIHFGLMLGLALATVACLESVGVILVVAMLVFPSVTASFFFVRLSSLLWASFPLGAAYSIGGFHLAQWLDCSLAGAMATFAGIVFIPCCLLGPQDGIIWKLRRGTNNFRMNETKKASG
jgi:manganese/zinc/iron transport system permease protein